MQMQQMSYQQPPPLQQQPQLQQLQPPPMQQHMLQNSQDQMHMHQMQQHQNQMPSMHMQQRPFKPDYDTIDPTLSAAFDAQMQSQSNAFFPQNPILANPQKSLPPQLQPPTVDEATEPVHKSEKKKKKEKHKNKDKEKSKDREERKKHKKDKDRHKDRDQTDESPSVGHEPLKITIPKKNIGLKITISKEQYENYSNTEGQSSHSKKKDKHRERDKDKSAKAISNAPKVSWLIACHFISFWWLNVNLL